MVFKHWKWRKKTLPDLVLLDMKIPGMDGIEILKRLKVIEPDIKVIIMTAYGELDMIQEAKDLGALTHFLNHSILMTSARRQKNT